MQVGMTLPVMEPELDAGILEEWARAIDDGPFSSLCFGERMAFDNPETLTLLGAVAAWTSRVQLVTTVVVPQLHDPVLLAKSLATGDLLSGGRLTVGVGVGGREEDYRAVGVPLSEQTMGGMASRVAVMRRVWAGEKITEAERPVGPPPVQPGGPDVLVGTMGPKTVRHAADWADGLAGVTLDLDVAAVGELFDAGAGVLVRGRAERRRGWPPRSSSRIGEREPARDAGAPPPAALHELAAVRPRRRDRARHRVRRHRGGARRSAASGSRTIGCDEVHLIPTSSDIDQVRRAADVVGRLDS